MTKEN
jgi:hypothetical protein